MPGPEKPQEQEQDKPPRPVIVPFGHGSKAATANDSTKLPPPVKPKSGGPGFDPFIFLDGGQPGTTAPGQAGTPVPAVNPYKDFKPLPSGLKVSPDSAADIPPLLASAEEVPPLNSKGTPIQVSNQACGQSVVQGMIIDAGGPHVSEQQLAGIRQTGTIGFNVSEWLDRWGGESAIHDHVTLADMRKLLKDGHQLIIPVKTRSTTSGHWIRLEGFKDGFLHYGDPWTGKSYRVPIANFVPIMDRMDIVSVKWPRGVVPPPDWSPPATTRPRRPTRPTPPPKAGISTSAETALHKVGVKHRVQLVKHGSQMTAIVLGPGGEIIEQIHYTPTSRSSTQKAARALIGAASDIGTVAMILETAGRMFFLLEAFHAIKEMADPERPLELLEKYADVLQAAAKAARAGDWTLVSVELVAWSQEMAKLGGPFASAGGGFVMWVQDHWLATFGAEAISSMPPEYLTWLAQSYREYVRKARAELARARSGVLEVPVEDDSDEPGTAPATVAVGRTTPPPRITHAGPELPKGLTREQRRERIGEQTAIVDDVTKTIRDIDNWLAELRRWEDKVTPDAERGEAWAVNTVAYIHRSRTANEELRTRKQGELETALDARTAWEQYPESEILEQRLPQPTFSGLTTAEIEHAVFHDAQVVAELETGIQHTRDYIYYLRDWRQAEDAVESPETIVFIDAQLQAHETFLQRRLSALEDARARLIEEELELRERVPVQPEESDWPSERQPGDGIPTTWLMPSLEEMREQARLAATEPSSFVLTMRDFFRKHPAAVRAAAIAAAVAVVGGGAWAAFAGLSGDDSAASASSTVETSQQSSGGGQAQPQVSTTTTTAQEGAGSQETPSPTEATTSPGAGTTVTETTRTETTTPVTQQPGNAQPTTTEAAPTEPPPTEDPPPTTTPPLVSGTYSGQATVITHPHSCCFNVASTWNVLQTRNTTNGVITLNLSGMLAGMPDMSIATVIPATGTPFTASGMHMVAGFTTVVSFSGVLNFDGLDGTFTVGGDHALPGDPDNDVSAWDISYVKTGGP